MGTGLTTTAATSAELEADVVGRAAAPLPKPQDAQQALRTPLQPILPRHRRISRTVSRKSS